MNAARTAALRLGCSTVSKRPAVAYAAAMSPECEDSVLMLRYRDGDISAFEALYRRHNNAVFRYLLRLCRHREAAEDVFQDVWGKVIKARQSYRPTAKFATFLYRVAHNCFVDYVRRNKRHACTDTLDDHAIAASTESPDAVTERALARRRLEAALLTLPDAQRDVYLLHAEAGLSLDDIAYVTGCKRETAKSRLRYALQKLRAAVDEAIETS